MKIKGTSIGEAVLQAKAGVSPTTKTIKNTTSTTNAFFIIFIVFPPILRFLVKDKTLPKSEDRENLMKIIEEQKELGAYIDSNLDGNMYKWTKAPDNFLNLILLNG